MINDKIGKLISELYTATGMLIRPAMENKTVSEAREKVLRVFFGLGELIGEIEAEKAIDNCRVRQLQMSEDGLGDCVTDENGMCLGYKDDGGMFEQCRVCEYSANFEDD